MRDFRSLIRIRSFFFFYTPWLKKRKAASSLPLACFLTCYFVYTIVIACPKHDAIPVLLPGNPSSTKLQPRQKTRISSSSIFPYFSHLSCRSVLFFFLTVANTLSTKKRRPMFYVHVHSIADYSTCVRWVAVTTTAAFLISYIYFEEAAAS